MEKNNSYGRFFSSIVASSIAEFITVPFDVVKVRLQVNNPLFKYTGMRNCLYTMYNKEGLRSLWKGVGPALLRQVCYNSVTMVLYTPIHSFYKNIFDDGGYMVKLLAAGNSGAISIAMFNWTEVVKTNMQTKYGGNTYSMLSSTRHIYRNCGLGGFFYGLRPNIYRSFIVNGIGLGTYEEIKERIIPFIGENTYCILLSSLLSGLITSVVSTPVDVIKTRMMDCNRDEYSSIIDASKKIITNEGYGGLFKGLVPICMRRMLWGTTFFLFYESVYSYGWRETINR